ncbi:hypothetical protein F2P81_008327 [Scophthalmus maximus]|uniref:Uncharacterized protein n=1 Tax=Scophthalmus maximus TaxID=52904 RepID=A0A6A4TD08_SCOMX|nr:hypothetical protein F2P81_008327 [Scophthalmus maximus]
MNTSSSPLVSGRESSDRYRVVSAVCTLPPAAAHRPKLRPQARKQTASSRTFPASELWANQSAGQSEGGPITERGGDGVVVSNCPRFLYVPDQNVRSPSSSVSVARNAPACGCARQAHIQRKRDLNRNNITRITKVDFSGLKNLRILHLEDNQISVIERGAFQDLRLLERLRVNRNKLQFLPELLFQSNPKLGRLHRKAYSKVVARSVQMCSQIDMWRHGKEKKGAWGTGERHRERERVMARNTQTRTNSHVAESETESACEAHMLQWVRQEMTVRQTTTTTAKEREEDQEPKERGAQTKASSVAFLVKVVLKQFAGGRGESALVTKRCRVFRSASFALLDPLRQLSEISCQARSVFCYENLQFELSCIKTLKRIGNITIVKFGPDLFLFNCRLLVVSVIMEVDFPAHVHRTTCRTRLSLQLNICLPSPIFEALFSFSAKFNPDTLRWHESGEQLCQCIKKINISPYLLRFFLSVSFFSPFCLATILSPPHLVSPASVFSLRRVGLIFIDVSINTALFSSQERIRAYECVRNINAALCSLLLIDGD